MFLCSLEKPCLLMVRKKSSTTYSRGEYELTNTSWSKLQNKYGLTKGRIYNALKGRRRPGGSQYQQKKRYARKLDTTTMCTNSETD